MRKIKDYCDHFGKELNFKKDYGDTEVTVLTFFKADLCAKCIEELDNIALEFFGKKDGAKMKGADT